MNVLYSHPGIPLIHHLEAVANGCKELIHEKSLNISFDKVVLEDLMYIAGAVHDIGKATTFFQDYLANPDETPKGPKHHALISALLARELSVKYLENQPLDEIHKEMLPQLIYVLVKRHHGNLQDFNKEFSIKEKSTDLLLQIQVIDTVQAQEILDYFLVKIDIEYDWTDFVQVIESGDYSQKMAYWVMDFFDETYSDLPEGAKATWYYLYQLMYSILLLSDKRDVILSEDLPSTKETWGFDWIERFRKSKGFDRPDSELNELKNQAFFETLQHLPDAFDESQHLYSITLPTGLGKTLTSLSVALKLKEMLPFSATKIIVAIPFTSIIDQNYQVYQEILENENSSLLLKHHHLSEPKYKMGEDSLDANQSQFLIETWESEVVVTTFVQILEAFFTNDKGKLLKFPQLVNSIVVLDEVQNIPYRLWPLIRAAFFAVGKMYNTYFIFMSATQPLIFDPESEIVELVPSYEQYFQSPLFQRTLLQNCIPTKITQDELVDKIIDFASDHPEKDILVILNTKLSARECFEVIAENFEDDNEVYFLSTLITPFERKVLIDRIKDDGIKRRKIVVSTQLIEAGVDISVDAIFRVLAPLDSLIQAAGRANRYNEKEEIATIFLYEIEELAKVDNMIYGSELLQKTRIVLKNTEKAIESDYLPLIQHYFREVQKQAEVITSKEKQALLKLSFAELGEFQLIEERKTNSVFVQLNSHAADLWKRYTEVFIREDLKSYEKKKLFNEFKADFYDYVINVPVRWDQDSIDFDSGEEMGFYVSKLDNPSRFYNYDPIDHSQNKGYVNPKTLSF